MPAIFAIRRTMRLAPCRYGEIEAACGTRRGDVGTKGFATYIVAAYLAGAAR